MTEFADAPIALDPLPAAELFDVAEKTALVTGGSSGLGFMIASALVQNGAHVWIAGRKAPQLEAAHNALRTKGKCQAIQADLSCDDGVDSLAEAMGGAVDALDILINNAGTSWGAPVDTYPRAAFDKLFSLNVTAPFMLVQRLLPMLRTAAKRSPPARIINIASIDGLCPPDLSSFAYSSSKAALIMQTRHLAKALAHERIAVNAIAPGVFPSRMTALFFETDHPAYTPAPQPPLRDGHGEAADIGGAILFLTSRAGSFLTGVTLPLAGGLATL